MKKVFLVISFFGLLIWGSAAYAVPVDLSTFSAEPNDSTIVDIGTDTITFTED